MFFKSKRISHQKIDMVDIFRSEKFVNEITKDAIKAGLK